jgi:hypothetical protein
MEHQLWREILGVLAMPCKRRGKGTYSDKDIVKVWFWAVLHDRPVSWACEPGNWPLQERRWPKPSSSTMSRRLRGAGVRHLLREVEKQVLAPRGQRLFWFIDGKPLMIGGCSKDRQAGFGRAAGGKAKGYKLHAIVSGDGAIAAWRVAPMNKDERAMARRLLRQAPIQGYVTADSNYDSNELHCTRSVGKKAICS